MRRPRLHVPGACYHATLRGNHQQDIFFSEADRQLLSHYVAAACERTGARIHAYCWMSNHIHLLIQVADAPLGAFMQRIGTRYARTIQARVPTTGHLFQNRYHALLVDVDRYFVALLRYIHLNPVRAGLVADPADYLWSSHGAYLGRTTQEWLTTDFGLSYFASTEVQARERYQTFVMQALGASRDPQLTTPPRGEPRVLGDESFAHRIARLPVTVVKPRGLDEIVDEVCRELGVSLAELQSPSQLRRLSRARGQVTSRALAAGAATLSEVAKRLNRSASALTRIAERYGRAR